MSKIMPLFGPPSDPTWFLPPYDKVELIPTEHNLRRIEYLGLTEEKKYQYQETLRLHLLKLSENGHSIFGQNQTIEQIISDIKKLNHLPMTGFLHLKDGNKYLSHSHLNVSNQWFPEMYDTKINGKSCLDQIRIPKFFHQNFTDIFIKDRHKAGERKLDNNYVSDTLLDSMRIVNGFQPAFNYPATLAKFIYSLNFELYNNNSNEFRIFDPCGGWAGRLTGALSAFCTPLFNDIKLSYHTTDVNTDTKDRYEQIVGFWDYYIYSSISRNFDLHRSFTPAEHLLTDKFFVDKENYYDFAFSSPPYFTKEVYSLDATQSCHMYSTYSEWVDGFLFGLLNTTYRLLKTGKVFWLNIADINTNRGNKSFYPLETDAVAMAEKLGFKLIGTYFMQQHLFPGSKSTKNKKTIDGKLWKFEPIFVFQK